MDPIFASGKQAFQAIMTVTDNGIGLIAFAILLHDLILLFFLRASSCIFRTLLL